MNRPEPSTTYVVDGLRQLDRRALGVVASARHEALGWLLVVNDRHLRCDLKEYVEHYNRARPDRSHDLRPPTGDPRHAAQVADGVALPRHRCGNCIGQLAAGAGHAPRWILRVVGAVQRKLNSGTRSGAGEGTQSVDSQRRD